MVPYCLYDVPAFFLSLSIFTQSFFTPFQGAGPAIAHTSPVPLSLWPRAYVGWVPPPMARPLLVDTQSGRFTPSGPIYENPAVGLDYAIAAGRGSLPAVGAGRRRSDCAPRRSQRHRLGRPAWPGPWPKPPPRAGKIRVRPVSERTPAKARIRLLRRPPSRSTERQRNGRRPLPSGGGAGVTDSLAAEAPMAGRLATD